MKISITKKLAGMVIAGSTAIFTMMPMTAFAQVPEEDAQVCICETKCDEEHINPECPVCSYDYVYCEGKEPEVTEEATETDGEKEEEPMGPLTPDGNLQLVDYYGSLEVGGKQFITVVTKSGNYFYIIIDRDDHGNENVHFLNMVDESDLLALMDDEQVEEYMNKTGVGEKDGQTTVVEDVTETEVEEPEVEVEKPVKKNNSGMIVIVLLVIGGAAGGYFYITKAKNKKPARNSDVDPDADYNEDEEDYLGTIPMDEEEDIDIPEIYDEEIEEDDED